MQTIAYLCSYKPDEISCLADLKHQREKILEYCSQKNYAISEFFNEENFARIDLKPLLLTIINKSYKTIERLVVINLDVISPDVEFRLWVEDELQRMGVIVEYVDCPQPQKTSNDHALKIRDRVKSIPSLPEVVVKVMELVQDKNSSAEALSRVITNDSGLTTRVLKLVNSSYYGFPKQIATIQHAITILGFTTIRGLVLSSSVYKMFKSSVNKDNIFDYKLFWKHNLLTAIGAKSLGKALGYAKLEDIFSSAILHDLGKIILAQYDYGNYAHAYALTCGSLDYAKNIALEEEACGTSHSEIAFLVTKNWNLPDAILDVILYHHSPLRCENNKFSCIIVHVADMLANMILYNHEFNTDIFDLTALSDFGISHNRIAEGYEKMVAELENIDDIERFFE